MANAVYPTYRTAVMTGTALDLRAATIKAVLVDTALYTYSAAHEFLSDVPAGARLATTAALTSPTVASGVFDAADATLPDAGGGATGEALILFVDNGTETTSRLLAYIDQASSGLPITLDGVDDTIQWNASGIFAL